MPNELDPLVNQWYTHQDKGQRFFITAIDTAAETVEIQHFDGDEEEFSFDEWRELDIDLSTEPENWSGALDITEQDDFGTEVTDTSQGDWDEPQKVFHDSAQEKLTPEPEASTDDYGEGHMEEKPLE